MERELLSEEDSGERDASFLRRTPEYSRNQCHLLSHAAAEDAGKLEGAGAWNFSLFAQGFTTHHALQKAEGDRPGNEIFSRDGRGAGGAAGSRAGPTAAKYEEGSVAARDVSHATAADGSGRFRVSSSHLVR